MNISVVVPISPIREHPEISILTKTVESVRHHLPDSEIFLLFDGVREEQTDRRADYEQAMYKTLWLADHDPLWKPCVPYVMDRHMHQVGMLRHVLDDIATPLMLFVEADTPLVTDELIAWPNIEDFIMSGKSNCVRLHHESVIPDAHAHMMHGVEEGYIRTSQFSARPHVATVAFYRKLLDCFTPEARTFVEDKAHGVLDEAFKVDGMRGWNLWRLHIYAKDPNNLKRSWHLDGRAGEDKFESSLVF